MNVAFLLGSITAGGIARATTIIANELANSENNEVFLFPYFHSYEKEKYQLNEKIICYPLNSTKKSLKGAYIPTLLKLHKYLKHNQIDILISCGALYFSLGAIACKGTIAKSISWEHSNYYSNAGHVGKKYNRKFGARLSDFSVVLTEQDKYNYKMHIRNDSTEFIYNPIVPELRQSHHIYLPDTKKIITVGTFNNFKNYCTLVDVAEKVFIRHPECSWDIYGEGSGKKEIEEKIYNLHLEKNIYLRGHCNYIYDVYNDYSLYVCTSRSEGLPMVLLEAKACKLPIVSFDIMTGPSEIISDGVNGYLIPFEDVELMSNRIVELLENKRKCTEFSDHAYDAIEKFEMNDCIHKWNIVFDKITRY